MALTVLIATVGGSCAPIVRSIRDNQPDVVYFICSEKSKRAVDGPGKVCGADPRNPTNPSIVAQAGLRPEQYEIGEVADVDDPQACVASVEAAYKAALARDAEATIIADYTGGTKTMTGALLLVACTRYARHSRLCVVTAQRTNTVRVQDGTESAQIHDAMTYALEDQWHAALRLAGGYHYASAESVLTEIMRHHRPTPLRRKTQTLMTLCRGFDAWDRFDHATAYRLLEGQGRIIGAMLRDLAILAGDPPATWGATCVLPVYDLLLNAERRAAQGRYDDAVARLYRALEMLEQNRLRCVHGIKTGDVDRAKVPRAWLSTLSQHTGSDSSENGADDAAAPGKLRIGLRESYALLAAYDDPMGRAFLQHEKSLSTALERRNTSILAHGTRPITRQDYPMLHEPVQRFFEQAVAETGLRLRPPAQFPSLTPDQIE